MRMLKNKKEEIYKEVMEGGSNKSSESSINTNSTKGSMASGVSTEDIVNDVNMDNIK